MASATTCNLFRQAKLGRNEPDFVTVVSVGSNQQSPNVDNFVTVLSIGTSPKNKDSKCSTTSNSDVHPEEEVEVFRLPGEPLGFGLKFEGGAKNAEKVKRLFVQSCAEQSPASRAKCSWGMIGEGDEVLSIDGVPVTQMSRLDCVRRLKESQLVIKLLVRCRGALRPEVVSAELKSPQPDNVSPEKKVPPELPPVPPPVPPRKLRHARGSADGDANPIPVKNKSSWNGSPALSSASSQDSPQRKNFENSSSSPRHGNDEFSPLKNSQDSPTTLKRNTNERSPEFVKSKQEPPEAMVYLDARSQDGSSTHGSTSDETGSSMSTVVDRFSTSDRISTISTTSTEQNVASDETIEEKSDERSSSLIRERLPTLEDFDQDFISSPSEYLIKRLANSEAVTHVESRGDANGVVEKITAVVAPNTILIEETLTLQPPLSFQDAPLSYGHETRPGLVYTADLAADSTTHFRPIRDEAEIVESVNGNADENNDEYETAPTLPARNHVNRIVVNHQENNANESAERIDGESNDAPTLPPKPLPRRDVKFKRKRPPPPPPPPRREPPPPPPPSSSSSVNLLDNGKLEILQVSVDSEASSTAVSVNSLNNNKQSPIRIEIPVAKIIDRRESWDDDGSSMSESYDSPSYGSPAKTISSDQESSLRTNKVLEIIEMKKIRALGESSEKSPSRSVSESEKLPSSSPKNNPDIPVVPVPREKRKVLDNKMKMSTVSIEMEDSEESNGSESWQEAKEFHENHCYDESLREENTEAENGVNAVSDEDDDDETYRSLDEIKEDFRGSETNETLTGSDDENVENGTPRVSANSEIERDSTSDEDESDDNDDDYYWQSNLATIGEEEEISSLEYVNANKDPINCEDKSTCPRLELTSDVTRGCNGEINEPTMRNNETISDVTKPEYVRRMSKETASTRDNKLDNRVNGKMENCGGDQRLPPDGDEFPATYQEFSACTSEQYEYVGKSTRLTTAGRNVKPIPEKVEVDEKTSTSLTTSSSSTKYTKNFVEKIGNESVKTLRIESTTMKNLTSNGPEVVSSFRESREKSSSWVATTKPKSEVGPQQNGDEFPEESSTKRTSLYENSSRKQSETPIVVTEKTFEVSGFYPKRAKASSFEKILNPPRETKDSSEARNSLDKNNCLEKKNSLEKMENNDYPDSPPPLPLTGPPKIDTSSLAKFDKVEIASPRKFSLSSDSRRQDDKSEKSVRDKIAMFSSQSSLESPLFPTSTPNTIPSPVATSNARKLSKYKSSDDVFSDEKIGEKRSAMIGRAQSYVDLTDSSKSNFNNDETAKNGYERPPSLPKTLPPEEPIFSRANKTMPEIYSRSSSEQSESSLKSGKIQSSQRFEENSGDKKMPFAMEIGYKMNSRGSQPSLTRATSFSGESTLFANEASQTGSSPISSNGLISRTNSLASTFRRNSDDMRRQSLNQLIEQRRKGISKLRGLVIPEKNSLPIDKPIIDLPEIKSRDSILCHQLHRTTIQDKWGSQSSLASNASTTSLPMKPTGTFKMPAPQIMSKYSPAFKRKSLTVYGTSTGNNNSTQAMTGQSQRQRDSPVQSSYSGLTIEPPKSLESICSPTRSDYSFEFVSSASVSPETMRNRSRAVPRKLRTDYDDSDNDSAVSSSQSSISRGFSPPSSPVPSERSSVSSSERSYHSSLIMDVTGRHCHQSNKETSIRPERSQQPCRPPYAERIYSNSSYSVNNSDRTTISAAINNSYSERSSSGGSSSSSSSSVVGSPNPRSPEVPRNSSSIPQRQQSLKRSSSTETNCSTGSSSTLTSGSQASAESLSRRVLKPQSVEAINRKNILASARCRSGRDLNGSPLIQRKFSTEEENLLLPVSSLAREIPEDSGLVETNDVKIAYIEITESFDESNSSLVEDNDKKSDHSTNGMKMSIRSEVRLEKSIPSLEPPKIVPRAISEETWRNDDDERLDYGVQKSRSMSDAKEIIVDGINEELLTTLTTKSRSRAPINLEDGDFARASRQMSLEDILGGKQHREKMEETSPQAVIDESGKGNRTTMRKLAPATLPRNRNNVSCHRVTSNNVENWPSEEKSSLFVSKIPTPGKSSIRSETTSEEPRAAARLVSRIPRELGNQRTTSLGRRSASVTDMKRALDKTEASPSPRREQNSQHHRFPSLDSNSGVEETATRVCEPESERFGSISSLASTTSLISQQELAQLVEDATSSYEDSRANHEVIVVLLHKENPNGSVGITLAGGLDCETKEITVHRVLGHSIADKDGRVQRGDRILSINGRSTRGLTHRESLAVLKQPRSEVVLVISRSRLDDTPRLRSRTESVETIIEGSEIGANYEETAWGPPTRVAIFKDGAGLGFSLAGGRDSPMGDRPLVIKKIFTGGAAEKTASLTAGDQLIQVNGIDVTKMTRIEAWSLMKKLNDGEVNLLVRHPAIKSS